MQQTTTAFVLHSRAFKETSLILHCFTQDFGIISLVAKGIKRKNAQSKRAILQPFNFLNISFTGKSELKTLIDAELKELSSQPKGNALACCYYLNELTLRSLKEWQEHRELFSVYLELIRLFEKCEDEEMPTLLRNYELALLSFLGMSPDWEFDIDELPINEKDCYEYINEAGFRKVLIATSKNEYSGHTINAISSGDFSAINLKECQKLTQKLLRPLIGDRPLESRKMWVVK